MPRYLKKKFKKNDRCESLKSVKFLRTKNKKDFEFLIVVSWNKFHQKMSRIIITEEKLDRI